MPDEIYRIELDRDGLHRQIAGGIPRGSLCVMEGMNGAGKSAVSQRLCYGFLKNGVSVTYISTELTTKGFIDQMYSLDYPIVSYILNRELLFIPVYPLIGTAKKRIDFLERLMSAKGLFERDITIIDTFSSLVINDMDRDASLDALSFFKKITGTNKSVVLTIDSADKLGDMFAPFETDSDVHIVFRMSSLEGATTRIMFVNRYINASKAIVDNFGFRIEPKVGFIIDITSVA